MFGAVKIVLDDDDELYDDDIVKLELEDKHKEWFMSPVEDVAAAATALALVLALVTTIDDNIGLVTATASTVLDDNEPVCGLISST